MTIEPRRSGRDFVGRDRELAELAAGLEDAVEGHGRLFLVAGEAGIGKTRLAEQLAAFAAERGAGVAWGRCWEGGGAPPYWPWAQVVRALADGADADTLRAWLGSGSAFVVRMAPDLAQRLGQAEPAPLQAVESDATRFCLLEATAGFLKRAAAARPRLLLLEDLHAADEASLVVLRYLARELRGARMLVVGTYRDAGLGRSPGVAEALGELAREGQVATLRGLARREVQRLVGDLVGAEPSDDLVAAVHEATEGNPLFVREAVRLLAASGAVGRPGRPTIPVPGSVRALIQQRLAPLSPAAVQVLSAAAVVGRSFDLALVGPACDLPIERVMAAVSEAQALGIVAEDASAPGRYSFAHALMREVIYEGLPVPVRAGLHLAVGTAIERGRGADADDRVAELSRHFAEAASAGEAGRALAYARRAGDRAMRSHAYEEAIGEYRRALHALDLSDPDDAARCDVLLALGEALIRAGRYAEAKEAHLRAGEIARRLGAPEPLARAALGYGEPHVQGGHVDRDLVALLREALDALPGDDSPLRARLLARLSVELTFSEEAHHCDALTREAVEMARRLDDARALGDALDARWMARWGPDGEAERAALAEETLRLAGRTGDRELELRGRAQRAAAALCAGDVLAVDADLAQYARLADGLRMPYHAWVATSMRAMRALLEGALDEAATLAEAALAHQPDRPNARWAHVNVLALARWEQGRLGELREAWRSLVERFPRAAFARGWLALADWEAGDAEAARRAVRMLAEQLPVRPKSGLWLPGLATAALACARLDDADAARRLYETLAPYAGHVVAMNMEHPVICFGSAELYLALLATAASEWDDAVGHFEAALRAHERLGAAALLARTRGEYARMLLRRGRPADREPARALLDRADAAARSLGMARLAADVAEVTRAPSSAPASVHEAPEPAAPAAASPAAPDEAATIAHDAAGAAVPPPSPSTSAAWRDQFRREGEYWTVAYDGLVVRLKDSKGLRQIALLLARPGQELHATDLEAHVAGPADAAPPATRGRADHGELGLRADAGDAGALLDAEARAAYKARLDELQAEIDEAEGFNDPVRAENARVEREFLVRELARAVGLGGRDRRAASHAERARLNATRAIRAAMANLAREHPSLGRHLAATIRTGRYCSYTPDPRTPVDWQL